MNEVEMNSSINMFVRKYNQETSCKQELKMQLEQGEITPEVFKKKVKKVDYHLWKYKHRIYNLIRWCIEKDFSVNNQEAMNLVSHLL